MPDPSVEITTPLGKILVRVAQERAPLSAGAFLDVVDSYAGGMTFWRSALMRTEDGAVALDIVQGGVTDPAGLPTIAHEPTSETGLRHDTGAISLGRFDPGTASGGAFFICLSDNPLLDAGNGRGDGLGYAAFGHVEAGLDVARAIQALPCGDEAPLPVLKGQVLADPVPILTMRRVEVADQD